MNVYTNNTFNGFWPVGSGAVVYAENQKEAAEMLNDRLSNIGLKGDVAPENMKLMSCTDGVRILCDGNY